MHCVLVKRAKVKMGYRCFFGLFVLAVGIAPFSICWAQGKSENDRLGTFLVDSGLSGLRMEQLLWELELETNSLRRQQLALELSAVIQASDYRRAAEQSWPEINQIRRVLSPFPALNNEGLRLSLLKAEVFLRFEDLMSIWKRTLVTAEAVEQLRELERLQDEGAIVKAQIENRLREAQLVTGSQPSASSQAKTELEGMLYETVFVEGWLCLGLSIANPENSQDWSEKTLVIGRQLLGLSDNSLTAFIQQKQISGLGERQIVLSMALASQRLGRQADAQGLWGMLADQSITQGYKDEINVWRFRGAVFYQQNLNVAEWFSPESFESTSVGERLALSREALLVADGLKQMRPEVSRSLANAAVLQLMMDDVWKEVQNQEPRLRELLTSDDWIIGWLEAGLLYYRYRSTGDRQLLLQSLESISVIVPSRVPEELPVPFRRALWLLAIKIQFDAQEFSVAITLADSYLQLPVSFGQRTGREQVLLVRAQSLVSLAVENRGLVTTANESINQFVREFPESRFLPQIELERFRLMRSTLNAVDSVSWLEQWVDSGGVGWQGEFALLRELAIRWNECVSSDGELAERMWKSFLNRQAIFVNDQQIPTEARLKSLLLMQQVVLKQPDLLDTYGHEQLMARIQQMRTELSSGNPAVSASYLIELEMAERRGDQQKATAIAKNILNNFMDDKSRKNALIVLAKDVETRGVDGGEGSAMLVSEAIEIYEELLSLYKPAEILTDPNAQLARLTLVRYLIRAGELKRAEEAWKPLAEAMPDDPQVLLLRGDIQVGRREYTAAVEDFKRVAFGVPQGSELWLQAKWGQLICLQNLDPSLAKDVAGQVLELVPDMKPEWRRRFEREID